MQKRSGRPMSSNSVITAIVSINLEGRRASQRLVLAQADK
jgi:hypothetical protein